MNIEPDGFNINEDCGAVAPQAMAEEVVRYRADIGIALDGDADRLILCDEQGEIIDGDQIIALIALAWKKAGLLTGDTVVATQMSNLGLEQFLGKNGVQLERSQVGDRYVVERMRTTGSNLGGEQSGHIVLSDLGPSGDGMIAALQVLRELVTSTKPASELLHVFDPSPQILKNVRYRPGSAPLENEAVQEAIEAGEKKLNGKGRLLVRKSGTEPLIRVMGEGERKLVSAVVDEVCGALESANG